MSSFKKNPRLSGSNYHPVWSNFATIASINFRLILFFLPAFLSFFCFLTLGGLIFLLAGLLLLLPAGPAVAAMYDVCYQMNMDESGTLFRPFMQSYRLNLRQGIAAMAVQLPFMAMLILVMIAPVERPVVLNVCVLISALMLLGFGNLTYSQIALIEKPLGSILKDSLLLIPRANWRVLLPALGQLVFIILLYPFLLVMIMLFIFAGPALLIAWSAKALWPVMEPMTREE